MKRILLIAGMCALAISAKAQDQDTTDVFDRHLHLEGVVVTGLTGDSRLSETPSPVSGISKPVIRNQGRNFTVKLEVQIL